MATTRGAGHERAEGLGDVRAAPTTTSPVDQGREEQAGARELAVFKRLDPHFYDIRHERALRWLEGGKTLETIAVLLGHHDLSVVVAASRPRGTKPAASRGATALRVVRRKEVQAS